MYHNQAYGSTALVAYNFDDVGAPSTAYDMSGNNNSLTSIDQSPKWVPGIRGNALQFSSNEYALTSKLVDLGTEWTMVTWVNFSYSWSL